MNLLIDSPGTGGWDGVGGTAVYLKSQDVEALNPLFPWGKPTVCGITKCVCQSFIKPVIWDTILEPLRKEVPGNYKKQYASNCSLNRFRDVRKPSFRLGTNAFRAIANSSCQNPINHNVSGAVSSLSVNNYPHLVKKRDVSNGLWKNSAVCKSLSFLVERGLRHRRARSANPNKTCCVWCPFEPLPRKGIKGQLNGIVFPNVPWKEYAMCITI